MRMNGFLGIYTELLQHGGVQRMGRHMALAQKRYAALHGLPLRLWSLNDPTGHHELLIDGEKIEFEGFARNHRRLLRKGLAEAGRTRFAYLNHVNLAPLGFIMKLRRPSLRYMVHVHGIEVWRPMALFRQFALSRASLITSTSHFTAQLMNEEQHLKMPRAEVLYPTLDPDFLLEGDDASQMAGLPGPLAQVLADRSPFAFTVSRLDSTEKYKGVDTAIRAFATLKDRVPAARYLIVGSGDDMPRLKAIVAEFGAQDRILFLGRQPDEVLRLLYKHCAVFTLPSAKEGLGIVFLEAMAKARPCIGGNTGGTPEVVRDGENGFLVSFDDAEKQSQRLEELLTNRALGDRMGKAGESILHDELVYGRFEERMHGLLDDGLMDRRSSLHSGKAPQKSTASPLASAQRT